MKYFRKSHIDLSICILELIECSVLQINEMFYQFVWLQWSRDGGEGVWIVAESELTYFEFMIGDGRIEEEEEVRGKVAYGALIKQRSVWENFKNEILLFDIHTDPGHVSSRRFWSIHWMFVSFWIPLWAIKNRESELGILKNG